MNFSSNHITLGGGVKPWRNMSKEERNLVIGFSIAGFVVVLLVAVMIGLYATPKTQPAGVTQAARSKPVVRMQKGGLASEAVALEALNATTPVVIFVSADWCGFCKKLMPEWEAVAMEGKFPNILMMRVDSKDASALMKQYGITGFPVILSNGGQKKYIGYRPKEKLEELLQEVSSSVGHGSRVNVHKCPHRS